MPDPVGGTVGQFTSPSTPLIDADGDPNRIHPKNRSSSSTAFPLELNYCWKKIGRFFYRKDSSLLKIYIVFLNLTPDAPSNK